MSRIRSVVDPEKIDIVVSLHAEMDHSGCLPQVIKEVKPSKTYSSIVGVHHLIQGEGGRGGHCTLCVRCAKSRVTWTRFPRYCSSFSAIAVGKIW